MPILYDSGSGSGRRGRGRTPPVPNLDELVDAHAVEAVVEEEGVRPGAGAGPGADEGDVVGQA